MAAHVEELEGELRVDEAVGGRAPDGLHHEHRQQVEDEGPLPVACLFGGLGLKGWSGVELG